MIAIALLTITLILPVKTMQTCPAVSIVANGVTAFATGTPQIGPFVNVQDYLYGNAAYPFGGLDYIEARCGIQLSADVFLGGE